MIARAGFILPTTAQLQLLILAAIETEVRPWRPCPCGNYWCELHNQHAHDCPCPALGEEDDSDRPTDDR